MTSVSWGLSSSTSAGGGINSKNMDKDNAFILNNNM